MMASSDLRKERNRSTIKPEKNLIISAMYLTSVASLGIFDMLEGSNGAKYEKVHMPEYLAKVRVNYITK